MKKKSKIPSKKPVPAVVGPGGKERKPPKIFEKDYKRFVKLVDMYYKIGVPYKYVRSGASTYLYVNGVCWYSYAVGQARELPANEIYFISKVKRFIEKEGRHTRGGKLYKNEAEIKYMDHDWGIEDGQGFDHCYSVDIDRAYWQAALELDYITKDIYYEGVKLDKRIRLAALGTFAKTKYHYSFDGQREVFDYKEDPVCPEVFLNCAYIVYKLMDGCKGIAGADFVFYWTDGVYVKSKAAAEACMVWLKEQGYPGKVAAIRRIERRGHLLRTHEREKRGKRWRPKLKDYMFGRVANFEHMESVIKRMAERRGEIKKG